MEKNLIFFLLQPTFIQNKMVLHGIIKNYTKTCIMVLSQVIRDCPVQKVYSCVIEKVTDIQDFQTDHTGKKTLFYEPRSINDFKKEKIPTKNISSVILEFLNTEVIYTNSIVLTNSSVCTNERQTDYSAGMRTEATERAKKQIHYTATDTSPKKRKFNILSQSCLSKRCEQENPLCVLVIELSFTLMPPSASMVQITQVLQLEEKHNTGK